MAGEATATFSDISPRQQLHPAGPLVLLPGTQPQEPGAARELESCWREQQGLGSQTQNPTIPTPTLNK